MAQNTDIVEFEKIIDWFKSTDHEKVPQKPSSEGSALVQRFLKLYAHNNRTSSPHEQILLQKYHTDWCKLFIRDKTFLPPLPEEYFVKLIFASDEDPLLSAQLDTYVFPFVGSKYRARVIIRHQELLNEILEPVKEREEDKIWFTSFKIALDEELAHESPEKLVSDFDVGVFTEIFESKKPKGFQGLIRCLQKASSRASFVKEISPVYLSCQRLLHTYLYYKWSPEKMKSFEKFFKDPKNVEIMKKWKANSAKKDNNRKRLTFPTNYPNGVSGDTIEIFVDYYGTDDFQANLFAIFLFDCRLLNSNLDVDIMSYILAQQELG